MYDPEPDTAIAEGDLPVEWDRPGVQKVLDLAVKTKRNLWPGAPANTPHVAIYPTHIEVEHYTDTPANPVGRAELVRDAILIYNRHRTVDEERSPTAKQRRHPPLSFKPRVHVEAIDHGGSVDEWIREYDLDAVTGEPVKPDPAEETETGSRFDALNPF